MTSLVVRDKERSVRACLEGAANSRKRLAAEGGSSVTPASSSTVVANRDLVHSFASGRKAQAGSPGRLAGYTRPASQTGERGPHMNAGAGVVSGALRRLFAGLFVFTFAACAVAAVLL